MPNQRLHLPEAVKREVRKRCHFGCVICGSPVFEYDHIDEYSKIFKHDAENITILCPLHHRLKTKGQLPTRYVRRANRTPKNGKSPYTSPISLPGYAFGPVTFVIGTDKYIYDVDPERLIPVILVDGIPFLGFQIVDDAILLDLVLHDSDLNPALIIRRGEVEVMTGVWDFTFVGQRLKINSTRYKAEIELKYGVDAIELTKGQMRGPLGKQVALSPHVTKIYVNGIESGHPGIAANNVVQNEMILIY